ncbi:hypothetical protein BDR03DRAFT_729131 [Suillus americanus]|nr:hypothetical protein BDR03DRAFT_729131 [Suillus americanus]
MALFVASNVGNQSMYLFMLYMSPFIISVSPRSRGFPAPRVSFLLSPYIFIFSCSHWTALIFLICMYRS